MIENKQKLEKLVNQFKEQGVIDIKLCKRKNNACIDDLLHDTVLVLQAILDKQYEPAKKFNDSYGRIIVPNYS